MSSDADYEFGHSFCSRRDNRVCAKDVCIFLTLVPPICSDRVTALITKRSCVLFVGIVIGGLFWSGFSFENTVLHVFQDGIVGVLTDSYNMGILVFLVILGIMVCMMNKAGGSAAFGRWASVHIKTRIGAQLATIVPGVLIFIDDYFNCLTVGTRGDQSQIRHGGIKSERLT